MLKLSKSPAIGNEYEIKNSAAQIINDALLVTLYNLAVSADKKKVGMPSLL